ncbi:GNAT family N-acetyltransferase [Proteus terrae]|uniref:GNAT family N-acetyltransferase n=1 Tax=Proteus terrae TaxID=1574161 RepID=UPI0032DAD5A1
MSIVIKETTSFIEAFNVLPFINSLDVYYPDINHWYINKVVPGLSLGGDKLIIAYDNDKVAGIALGKASDEFKLRCIRVHPEYQGAGLDVRLIDKMLDELGVMNPLVTVSEELIHHYSRIFVNRYKFELAHVHKGLYRVGKLEYSFNG